MMTSANPAPACSPSTAPPSAPPTVLKRHLNRRRRFTLAGSTLTRRDVLNCRNAGRYETRRCSSDVASANLPSCIGANAKKGSHRRLSSLGQQPEQARRLSRGWPGCSPSGGTFSTRPPPRGPEKGEPCLGPPRLLPSSSVASRAKAAWRVHAQWTRREATEGRFG
jgi:hypothetical protein